VATEESLQRLAREAGLVSPLERLEIREERVERSGYPPWQVVLTQSGPSGRHERVIHKRLAEVQPADLIGAWRDHSICCG
jgi:hypothetical protein